MKIITSEIVAGYLHCQRKGFFLLIGKENGSPHEMDEIVTFNTKKNRNEYLYSLEKEGHKIQTFTPECFAGRTGLLADVKLEAGDLSASLDILTKAMSESRGFSYEPTLISGSYSIQSEDKIKLLFSAYVLTQLQGKSPKHGFIVTMGPARKKIKLENGYRPVVKTIEVLRGWASSTSAEAPHVMLNKHCSVCQFRHQCRTTAEDLDDLSLLDRMTPKVIGKYHKKGIFTVQQLSYLFQSRRIRKRRSNAPVRFNFELQALAIRTEKTYIQAAPKVSKNNPKLFLDIEGIPDQDFYYLFGLLVVDGTDKTYYAHWADDKTEEMAAWNDLLKTISRFPDAPIYHYGNYEVGAVDRLQKRYALDSPSIKERLVNANSFVFGKVYFPTRSNGLKDLGRYLDMTWTEPEASGLKSLVWRYCWERSRAQGHKESLVTYNQEDCTALSILVEFLTKIGEVGSDQSKFRSADEPTKNTTELGVKIHNHFETILKSAYADYGKNKISIRRSRLAGDVEQEKVARNTGHQAYVRLVPPKFGKTVLLHPEERCPQHKRELLRISEKMVQKIITDLVFTKSGCRKVITKYVGHKSYCWRTGKHYPPSGFDKLERTAFGHSFKAWIIYQRLVLRLPYGAIIQTMAELFQERISETTIIKYIFDLSLYYEQSEKNNAQLLLKSPAIHVDETQVNIQGTNHYVWVFTDGKHVLFRWTETRESRIVHDFLSDYKGVLVSDFYPGYDSVSCAQQKCWVHLIRDINEDLWKSPFNIEFESFVLEVRNLIVPIFDAVDRYGLKTRNLRKFHRDVERFYKKSIVGKEYKFEATVKYQKRFHRYKESLFTFLDQDSVPWNNNMAERAIRHLAVQRKISGTFYKTVVRQYLLLLGIAQTCRFQGKSVLKFLLSGEKDVNLFKASRPIRHSVAVTPESHLA